MRAWMLKCTWVCSSWVSGTKAIKRAEACMFKVCLAAVQSDKDYKQNLTAGGQVQSHSNDKTVL